MENNEVIGEQTEQIVTQPEPLTPATGKDEQIIAELSEKYGYDAETVSQMVSIYESLSLKDFFKAGNDICVLEIVEDKGRQPIPVASSNFEVDPSEIVKIVETKDGKNVEVEVIMKPVLNVRLLNTDNAGKIYSRIPSNSEMIGLLKLEYQRLQQGMGMDGALIKIVEAKFVDKTGTERDGYGVEQVSKEFVAKLLQIPHAG